MPVNILNMPWVTCHYVVVSGRLIFLVEKVKPACAFRACCWTAVTLITNCPDPGEGQTSIRPAMDNEREGHYLPLSFLRLLLRHNVLAEGEYRIPYRLTAYHWFDNGKLREVTSYYCHQTSMLRRFFVIATVVAHRCWLFNDSTHAPLRHWSVRYTGLASLFMPV